MPKLVRDTEAATAAVEDRGHIAAAERIIDTGGQGGTPVDYLDGVVFSADESYLCVGRRTTTAGPVVFWRDGRVTRTRGRVELKSLSSSR